jgi:hypothetical protein
MSYSKAVALQRLLRFLQQQLPPFSFGALRRLQEGL